MPKLLYFYCSSKEQLLKKYDRLFTKKELHNHFFFNRDYQNETKKELLKEIEKNYTKEFLRDDLIDFEATSNKKIFFGYNSMSRQLKKLPSMTKSEIIKFIRCYVHPDDCKYLWKRKKHELINFIENY